MWCSSIDIGAGFDPDIGWYGGPSAAVLMTDVNDLSTLPIGTNVDTVSTFFLDTITLQNGDTLSGSTGSGGPDGTFQVLAAVAVPEPASLALLALGLAGLAGLRLRSA
ncbi:MAG: PEP-CTERM sorting domain-containing protein [Burkholderiales bacterium]|nr:PEP-CTERM sorting domain-containing protein [Burkholderiales bacterium]